MRSMCSQYEANTRSIAYTTYVATHETAISYVRGMKWNGILHNPSNIKAIKQATACPFVLALAQICSDSEHGTLGSFAPCITHHTHRMRQHGIEVSSTSISQHHR